MRRGSLGVAHRLDLARPGQRRGAYPPAENDVRRLLVLLAPKVQKEKKDVRTVAFKKLLRFSEKRLKNFSF